MFYTDDVGVFSATRRLTLDGDPTQPALDDRSTGQGSDAVFESMLDVARSFWTLVSHLEWQVAKPVKWIIGYHYEHGTANG